MCMCALLVSFIGVWQKANPETPAFCRGGILLKCASISKPSSLLLDRMWGLHFQCLHHNVKCFVILCCLCGRFSSTVIWKHGTFSAWTGRRVTTCSSSAGQTDFFQTNHEQVHVDPEELVLWWICCDARFVVGGSSWMIRPRVTHVPAAIPPASGEQTPRKVCVCHQKHLIYAMWPVMPWFSLLGMLARKVLGPFVMEDKSQSNTSLDTQPSSERGLCSSTGCLLKAVWLSLWCLCLSWIV